MELAWGDADADAIAYYLERLFVNPVAPEFQSVISEQLASISFLLQMIMASLPVSSSILLSLMTLLRNAAELSQALIRDREIHGESLTPWRHGQCTPPPLAAVLQQVEDRLCKSAPCQLPSRRPSSLPRLGFLLGRDTKHQAAWKSSNPTSTTLRPLLLS